MGKSKRDDDELKKLKKLKKLLGEDKLRQELEKVSGKQERKKSKKKSRHSSEEVVWEEKEAEKTNKNEDHSNNQDKRGDKLQWMYKGADDLVDTEDYLLGKKVDQAIVRKQRGETAEKSEDASSSVGAIFDTSLSANTQAVDMANKLREDPLFMIKQQEINKKKDLLNNPVRMKQLQQLLQKSKQSKKKKKKQKKRRNESSSDDSSDSNSDDVKGHKHQGLMRSKQTHQRIPDDDRYSRYEGRQGGSGPHRKPDNHSRDRDRHRSPIRRQRSRSPVRSCSGHMSRSRSPRNRSSGSAKKMDAKELERRRAEMIENAKSRDEDRKNRVQRYRDDDRAEKEAEKKKSHKAKFVEPMKLSATSVEDRIKRNIYNIQRTSVALDKNFAKR